MVAAERVFLFSVLFPGLTRLDTREGSFRGLPSETDQVFEHPLFVGFLKATVQFQKQI